MRQVQVMATAAAATTYPHITKTPGVCGGKACIDGTRVRVMDIVVLHEKGLAPEAMLTHYSSRALTLAEVHAALAYYYDHKDEIERSFEKDERAEAEHETKREEYLRRRASR
jgi:uncharacterized protein (DUF433 family)